jgi:hypothetical protein
LGATFSTGKVIHKFGKHWLGYIWAIFFHKLIRSPWFFFGGGACRKCSFALHTKRENWLLGALTVFYQKSFPEPLKCFCIFKNMPETRLPDAIFSNQKFG